MSILSNDEIAVMIAERLVLERKRLGLEQDYVREVLGIANSTMSRYENAKRSPDVILAKRLSDIGYDMAYVISGERSTVPTTNPSKAEEVVQIDRLIKVRVQQDDDGSELLEPSALQDILRSYAYDIETSLIEAGAKQGEYTLLDLYSLAQPFALADWNKE